MPYGAAHILTMGETKAKTSQSKRGPKPKFSKALFNAVLARIAQNESTVKAIRAEGISPTQFYYHVNQTPEFPDLLQKAQAGRDERFKQQTIETLEQTAISRAVEGWDEPVFYEGKLCGTKRKYSDSLLMFMLKGLKPDVYKEGANINVNNTNSNANAVVMSDETKKQVAADYRTLQSIISKRGEAAIA